uniref:Uncharacterized protein n=1 Tax=Zooxanthella nutricula TaxID=1333877 RepID=A0A7S2P1P2_9DINO
MGCEGCGTRSKILFGIGGLLALIGVILFAVMMVTGNSAVTVDFMSADQQNFNLEITQHPGCKVALLALRTANCDAVYTATSVTDPDSQSVSISKDCSPFFEEDWVKNNNPPLRKMGRISQGKTGTYRVQSTFKLWAVDECGQVAEAVGGILAAMGLFVVMIIIFIVSCIFCCIGCCCMESRSKVVVTTGANQVAVVPAASGPATVVPAS